MSDWTPTWEYRPPVRKQADFVLDQPIKYYRVVQLASDTFEIQSRMELAKNWDRVGGQVPSLPEAQRTIESIE